MPMAIPRGRRPLVRCSICGCDRGGYRGSVKRSDEDEGASLEPELPIVYERNDLADDIAYLAQFPQATIASEIGMSERRWRDIVHARTTHRDTRAARIRAIAMNYRLRQTQNARHKPH